VRCWYHKLPTVSTCGHPVIPVARVCSRSDTSLAHRPLFQSVTVPLQLQTVSQKVFWRTLNCLSPALVYKSCLLVTRDFYVRWYLRDQQNPAIWLDPPKLFTSAKKITKVPRLPFPPVGRTGVHETSGSTSSKVSTASFHHFRGQSTVTSFGIIILWLLIASTY
jgi:hypothetical protein